MDLNKLTKKELLEICSKLGITRCKSKNKTFIVELIQDKKNGYNNDKEKEIEEEKEIENTTQNKDLYSENLSIIKEQIKDKKILEVIEKKYRENKENLNNVYNFIYSYIYGIKLIHQNYLQVDYTLYNNIIQNNKIKVIWGNCLDNLKKLPSESVGLMCTSPPYYNARDYSTWPDLKSYLDFMTQVIKECYRVLDNHRVFVFNISDVVGNDNMDKIKCMGERKIPLPSYFINIFEECGFTFVDDIIWDKGEVQSSRHKNKNTPYPFYQYPLNCYEHILIFHKHRLEKDIKYPCSSCGSLNVKSNSYTYKGLRSWECCNPSCQRSESDRGKRFSLKTIITQDTNKQNKNIIPGEFIDAWRRDIHKLNPVIKINNKKENVLGHTAPFPREIPEMAIRYYSYAGDIVLDMFGGSFTTAIEAYKLNRIGIGMELRKDLFETCIKNNITNNDCAFEEL